MTKRTVANNFLYYLFCGFSGAVTSLIVWLFLKLMGLGIGLVWDTIPSNFDFKFYPIIVCTAGGIILGIWQKLTNAVPDELDEVMNLSDRILVMYEGEIVGFYEGEINSMEKNFGTRVRQARHKAGLTQAALAEKLNLDETTISRIENGSQATSFATMLNFSEALDVKFDYLICDYLDDSIHSKDPINADIWRNLHEIRFMFFSKS